jgi:hypothetical protein
MDSHCQRRLEWRVARRSRGRGLVRRANAGANGISAAPRAPRNWYHQSCLVGIAYELCWARVFRLEAQGASDFQPFAVLACLQTYACLPTAHFASVAHLKCFSSGTTQFWRRLSRGRVNVEQTTAQCPASNLNHPPCSTIAIAPGSRCRRRVSSTRLQSTHI